MDKQNTPNVLFYGAMMLDFPYETKETEIISYKNAILPIKVFTLDSFKADDYPCLS